MPNIQQINEYVPKNNRYTNISQDPSQNTVMGNIKLLHDTMAASMENGTISKNEDNNRLTAYLSALMTADQANAFIGADTILNDLFNSLYSVYRNEACEKEGAGADEAVRRAALKNIIQYVAAGLDMGEAFDASGEQLDNVKARKEAGRKAVAKEKDKKLNKGVDPDTVQRRMNAMKKHLDRCKDAADRERVLSEVPADEIEGLNQDQKKQHLDKVKERRKAALGKEIRNTCKSVLALRLAANLADGGKAALNEPVDEKLQNDYDAFCTELDQNKPFNKFLNSRSDKDLIALAKKNNGADLADAYKNFVLKDIENITGDIQEEFRPTAKAGTEALKEAVSHQV